ncbi:replication initiation protein [Campylobacter sp. MOP7]|uniref:replication initiation protein n=1 Tax=Campylobacter canis TaxID=3378588 RepID=UPI00387EA028
MDNNHNSNTYLPIPTSIDNKIYDANFLDDDKYNKILKANSVIRGRVVVDESNSLKINVYDLKVLNFLLKTLQECIKKDSKPVKFTTLVIPIELYKKVVDDGRNWRTNFIKSVKKLEKIAFELNNYRDIDKDEYIYWQSTRLVVSPKFSVQGSDKKNATCEVSFTQELSSTCWEKSNYTHLDFKTLNSFKSKYAIRFYENLISKIQNSVNENNYKTEYDFRQNELEIIFETDLSTISKGLKKFLSSQIHFEDVVIPDLKTKLNFEYRVYSKDKIITFIFDKNYLEQFRTQKRDVIDLSLEKFRNLIDASKVYDDGHNRIYEIDKEKPDDAMAAFLEEIRMYYPNIPLLERSEEVEIFGNIAMNRDGDLYYLGSFKRISYKKVKKFLIYLYKNNYETIMKEIKKRKVGKIVSFSDELGSDEKNNTKNDPSLFGDGLL